MALALLALAFAVWWCRPQPKPHTADETPPPVNEGTPNPKYPPKIVQEIPAAPLPESEHRRYYTPKGEQASIRIGQQQYDTVLAFNPQLRTTQSGFHMTVTSADGSSTASLSVDGWQVGNHDFTLDATVFGHHITGSGQTLSITRSDAKGVTGTFSLETPSVTATDVPEAPMDQPNIPVAADGTPLQPGETPAPMRMTDPRGRSLSFVPGRITGEFHLLFP